MIVPTTLLSLAALSAAESNSFGRRGLARTGPETPTTGIAVVAGTAVLGIVAGLGIGSIAFGGGDKSHKTDKTCPEDPKGTVGCISYVAPTGCNAGYYADALKSCAACPGGKNIATADFADPYVTIDPATCTGCRIGFYQDSTTSCKENGAGIDSTPTTAFLGAEPAEKWASLKIGCLPNYYEDSEKHCAKCPTATPKRDDPVSFKATWAEQTAVQALCIAR